MSTHVPIQNVIQRQAPTVAMPVQQAGGFVNQPVQQQAVPSAASHYPTNQPAIDPDLKKIQDMCEAINLVTSVKKNIHLILENVGKANSANNYANVNKPVSENQDASKTAPALTAIQAGSIGTPINVSNVYNQNPPTSNPSETEQTSSNDNYEKNQNLNESETEFFEKTDTKYMVGKIVEINKSIRFFLNILFKILNDNNFF